MCFFSFKSSFRFKHVIPFSKLIFGWAEIFNAGHGLCLVAASRDYSSLRCVDSHCGGFSCCEAQALGTWASAVAAHGLQSTGSVVVMNRLSCSLACGLLLEQILNPCPLHWQADSQPLDHQGKPLHFFVHLTLDQFDTTHSLVFFILISCSSRHSIMLFL